jgi:hypothetical protein
MTGHHGVADAMMYYGYNPPYTQTVVAGIWPGGTGEGGWVFKVPPQGQNMEGSTFSFSIVALDGDLTPETSVNNNNGNYFNVTVKQPYRIHMPIIRRTN